MKGGERSLNLHPQCVLRAIREVRPIHPTPILRRARILTQGRRIVQNALIASIPRTRPAVWVSDERVMRAGLDLNALTPFPRNVSMALTQIPKRLFWKIKLRSPEWDARLRKARRAADECHRAERLVLAALPPLEFTVTPLQRSSS